MADNTSVNGQITDAVTQANVTVLGDAPAMAVAAMGQMLTSSMGVLFANMVAAQQQMGVVAQAATTQGVAQIYGSGSASGDSMLGLVTALKATEAVG